MVSHKLDLLAIGCTNPNDKYMCWIIPSCLHSKILMVSFKVDIMETTSTNDKS
jgi:hypothetical protein